MRLRRAHVIPPPGGGAGGNGGDGVSDGAPAAHPGAALPPGDPLLMPRATLLVVEDEPEVLEIACNALDGLGYRTLPAEDGGRALATLEAHPEIDLLFTDIVMPGELNGVELAIEVRRRRPGLPVIFASGYSTDSLLTQLPPHSVFMQKPYRLAALSAHIEACLLRVGRP